MTAPFVVPAPCQADRLDGSSSEGVVPVKYLLTLGVGVAGGFVLAHLVNQTPGGAAFFTGLDSRLKSFTTAVVDGYTTRDAELRDQA